VKVWDASTGITYPEATPSFNFLSNDIMGTFSDPVIVQTGDIREQVIELAKGWTWVSFAVDDQSKNTVVELFEGLEVSNGDLIKSQTQFSLYDDGWGTDDLVNLSVEEAYKIKLSSQNDLYLKGLAVDLETYSVTLGAGWNWLSYPLFQNQPINDALGLLDKAENDMIKDQHSFALYDNTLGWVGSLTHLKPGNGYILYAQNGGEFHYRNINPFTNRMVEEYVDIRKSKAENTIPVIATIDAGEFLEGDILYAMANNEEIGRAVRIILNGNEYRYFMSLDVVPEPAQFYLSRAGITYRLRTSQDPPDLIGENSIIGSLDEPLMLILDGEVLSDLSLSVYPNANNGKFNIQIGTDSESEVELQVFDIHGRICWRDRQTIEGRFIKEMDLNVPSGLYILKAVRDGALVETVKFIVNR